MQGFDTSFSQNIDVECRMQIGRTSDNHSDKIRGVHCLRPDKVTLMSDHVRHSVVLPHAAASTSQTSQCRAGKGKGASLLVSWDLEVALQRRRRRPAQTTLSRFIAAHGDDELTTQRPKTSSFRIRVSSKPHSVLWKKVMHIVRTASLGSQSRQ